MINYSYLIENIEKINKTFQEEKPFKNIYIDNFLIQDHLQGLVREYEISNWDTYKHYNENKQCITEKFPDLVSELVSELNSEKFLKVLERITGLDSLIPDLLMRSGGMHRSTKGSFLNVHADFTVHPNYKNWERKLNLLIYLTPIWDQGWGGNLELWDTDMLRCEKFIQPVFNRAVIFETNHNSYHGHPEPIQCPEGIYRNSLAMYYYQNSMNVPIIPTNYRARPTDNNIKAFLIGLDKQLVKGYHLYKMITNNNDRAGVKLLSIFSRNKKK